MKIRFVRRIFNLALLAILLLSSLLVLALAQPALAATGNALHFDTSGDYVHVNTNVPLGGNITYEAWIRTSSTSDWMGIVSTETTAAGFLQFVTTASGYLRAEANNGSGNYWINATTTPINDGNWHHVAVTFEAATETFHLYVDGIDQAFTTTNHTPVNSLNLNSRLYIGSSRLPSYPGGWFNGTIDEVRVWNVVRSQVEIQANMNSEISPQAGLVAYYQLNEGVANGNNAGVTTASNSKYDSIRFKFKLVKHKPEYRLPI